MTHGFSCDLIYTWINCNEFAHLLRNSIRIDNTFFERHMCLTMANNAHIEMVHELFGDTIWCTNYDLIHILKSIINCKLLSFWACRVSFIYALPCTQVHLTHVHGYSWLGNWILCICLQLDRYASPQLSSRPAYALSRGNPNGQHGINRMHQPRTPGWENWKTWLDTFNCRRNCEKTTEYLEWNILTILSVRAGCFPSLNWMIFWVVGKNWQQPVQGDRAEWSMPKLDEPFIHLRTSKQIMRDTKFVKTDLFQWTSHLERIQTVNMNVKQTFFFNGVFVIALLEMVFSEQKHPSNDISGRNSCGSTYFPKKNTVVIIAAHYVPFLSFI